MKLNKQQRLEIYKQAKAHLEQGAWPRYLCGVLNSILFWGNYTRKHLTSKDTLKLFPEFKLFEPTPEEKKEWDWSIYYNVWFDVSNNEAERHICLDFCIAMLEQ